MLKDRNKIALTYKGQTYTYKQILQYSKIYCDAFSLEKTPEKVLICSDNSPEWCFALYGALRAKAVVVPVDTQSTKNEIEYVINDCKPDIVFVSNEKRDFFETINVQGAQIITPADLYIENVDSIKAADIPIGNDDDTIFIIYTSGTTGSPKGVMLSIKNVMFNVNAVSKAVPIFRTESNVMVLLPLHHIFPLLGSMLIPLYVGSTLHIAEAMNAESILKTLNEGKVSLIIGVPRLYDMLVKGIMAK
ncbi:MAG: acyl--CoA ligase [Bacteroidales bacterium]|nr:acyl--CoA ligase [Bacteroidales bacterium]